MNHRLLQLGLGILALAVTASFAQAKSPFAPEASADVPLGSVNHALRAAGVSSSAVTEADVGDSDSFGRSLLWLGLTDMSVDLSSDCTGDPACQVLASALALTTFSFQDLNHIALPAKAANSLLCYWLSPLLTVTYSNPTAAPVVARLTVNPTLTVENPVLAAPGLIDPTTGLPFGGKLLTAMTSLQSFQVPVPAGLTFTERKRDSAVCIAGFLSRKSLVETYGLTSAQASDFFKNPTTVRLNLSGSAQYVSDAALYFGFRIIGD